MLEVIHRQNMFLKKQSEKEGKRNFSVNKLSERRSEEE